MHIRKTIDKTERRINMYETFFISDLHLGHKNALAFDNRPFLSVDEQNKTIIENWNKTVDDLDTVYILGDISFYGPVKTCEIFNQLNGKKHLIIGNHDHKLLKNQDVKRLFVDIQEKETITINKQTLVLHHTPIQFFDNAHHGGYHFYGHVHNNDEWNFLEYNKRLIEEHNRTPHNMFNVGCMLPYMNYTPRTFDEIVNYSETTKWKQINSTQQKCMNCETVFTIYSYPVQTNNFCPNCGKRIENIEANFE